MRAAARVDPSGNSMLSVVAEDARFVPNSPYEGAARSPLGVGYGSVRRRSWSVFDGLDDLGRTWFDEWAPAQESELRQLASVITGSKHGINRTIERGVSPAAMLDAVSSPLRVMDDDDGTTLYVGREATVRLNAAGSVVSTYPKRSK
jgi:hypothetical protein